MQPTSSQRRYWPWEMLVLGRTKACAGGLAAPGEWDSTSAADNTVGIAWAQTSQAPSDCH